jgi:histidine triad (HIT) family protein
MNILNNNGAVAYQSVFHSHIHLIPRYSDQDDFGITFSDNSGQYDEQKYQAVQQAIIDQFGD